MPQKSHAWRVGTQQNEYTKLLVEQWRYQQKNRTESKQSHRTTFSENSQWTGFCNPVEWGKYCVEFKVSGRKQGLRRNSLDHPEDWWFDRGIWSQCTNYGCGNCDSGLCTGYDSNMVWAKITNSYQTADWDKRAIFAAVVREVVGKSLTTWTTIEGDRIKYKVRYVDIPSSVEVRFLRKRDGEYSSWAKIDFDPSGSSTFGNKVCSYIMAFAGAVTVAVQPIVATIAAAAGTAVFLC